MVITAGPHRHTSTSGVKIHVERRISQQLVDLVVASIERGGKTPDDVYAVEWHGEGAVLLYCLVEVDGRPVTPIEYEVVRV